ncbi:hydroxymethylglutaryl-CoA synthase [Listeria ivanovii]|uniref:hydroxymethylglutaryl-CoA synthase n=1 Tax=Listeria ivanovii TaxID=1638 RepID=UPI000512721D|nr:hydroxymethylglutaryl-CoA synthase [Listeria ivanovii]AIS62650.1 hydroxymethylglutaryl-CoA synthase [Listeria ivanovii subsp. londoniensis]MBK1967232.1 hydroxymethylglutaryl-CoA synthase [Listeria ivanovii subsp. londoniensis]MBK1985170.1 hydroxymethylglutaryl-CoA synthase [Listeria ivanovii subsp. londoniensis]MBK1996656.1 hydroxymethylglutaryl-CoA synthase [Listeria ivanovii subsp. londoniensis]MBM5721046.1 hydroxymethylglutaryl-CoA synthase [Listeria ivanovii]
MKIGIDKIGFYTPAFYVDMVELAEARNIDPNKFTIGIGQDKMAFAPITQDSVTMGANAARQILDDDDLKTIDLVILATESGIDESKAGAVYIHRLLGIQPFSRAIEIKEACYGATAGIHLAKDYVAKHPESKVLVIGSDIARYGLATAGEATQGAGAVAMLISANPRCITLQDDNVFYTEDIMDFWRPVYSEYACVEGKYSTEQYIHFFETIWSRYTEKFNQKLEDFAAICFHLPYTKMGKKALDLIIETAPAEVQEKLLENYRLSTLYSRNIGNIYTGSLYLSFISLLDHQDNLQENDKIGFFSYGSGAVGEFFHGSLQPGFKKQIQRNQHAELLKNRTKLSVTDYETKFKQQLPKDGSTLEINPTSDPAEIILTGIQGHKRQYIRK